LHAKSFVNENERAIDGSEIIVPGVAVLSENFTVPALGTSSGNFRVEYKPGTTSNVFVSGDTVVNRTFSRDKGALIVSNAVGTVTSPANQTGYQEWTFTRASGDNGGTMPSSTGVPAKTGGLDSAVGGAGVG